MDDFQSTIADFKNTVPDVERFMYKILIAPRTIWNKQCQA
jgi:hypothetical protein